jgi:nitroimidazol reductase NimA-like FMN-containing flavoprotein (pyridoxamine 5'-phosphate oxidase superfamily)
MTAAPEPRSLQQRVADTRARLDTDVDVWVSSADPASGTPYLVPLSFLWDGAALVISTPAASPTARNLAATGQVRIGLGLTRDVVLIEGTATMHTAAEMGEATCDAFAAKAEFDPRTLRTEYGWFRVTPRRIQAWREVDELADRELMRDGQWLAEGT